MPTSSSHDKPQPRKTPHGEVPWTNLETHDFDTVLQAELANIVERREEIRRHESERASSADRDKSQGPPRSADCEPAVNDSLVGLALSGGGIRSGAFSLGVLAAMKKTRVLDAVDYLSTVSGGGYAGAFWSSWALTSEAEQAKHKIEFDGSGSASPRLRQFIHSGNYLAQAANFFNRYIPGLVLILMLTASGLIAGASGLAYLFREIDRPEYSDAVAALGFDGDILRALFPSMCFFVLWSLAWCASYWKYGTRSQAWLSGLLFWPLIISVLASAGILLATGDIGLPGIETLMGAAPDGRTVPNSFWYVLYSVVGASLLPYLRLPMLIRSGLSPNNVTEKYVFRIASAALLVGVPFVAFTWMAREDISGYLDKRGPEMAEADLFGGLQPSEREVVFEVLRKMAEHEEFMGSGNVDLRTALTEKGLDDFKIRRVLKLNREYVNDSEMTLPKVINELEKLTLTDQQLEFVKTQIQICYQRTRDWTNAAQRLKDAAPKDKTVSDRDKHHFVLLARTFLEDENTDRAWLRAELEKSNFPAKHLDNFITSTRALFPLREAATSRRKALDEEIRPVVSQYDSQKQTAISDYVWRFATLEDYVRHELSKDMEAQSVGDEDQTKLVSVARNYWPPRHHDVIDEWNRLFAQQAVHELPHTGDQVSVQSFAGAAVAKEKMTIAQRLRYLASLAFHWGVTPLVEDEASGIERNLLWEIWKVRQRRRAVESELVTRLNGQILANHEFVNVIHQLVTGHDPWTSKLQAASVLQSFGLGGKFLISSSPILNPPEPILEPLTSDQINQIQNSQLRHSVEEASSASQGWIDWLTQPEKSTDRSADELKDEEDVTESLTNQRAVDSVMREDRRQKLVLANRKLLEAFIAYQTPAVSTSQPTGAAAKTTSNPQPNSLRPVSLHSAGRVFGRTVLSRDQEFRKWVFWRAGLVFLFLLFVIDLNSTSLHGFYRIRLAANWIESVPGLGREIPLAQLNTTTRGQPYHLISTSLNLLGRRSKDLGNSRSDHFLFSQLHCGSERTGYVSTDQYAGGDYKLADAISVSGAAVSPAQNTGLLIRALLFLGNLRLGQWLPNPAFRSWSLTPRWVQSLRFWYYFTPGRFLWEGWQLAEQRPFVFISDGGHHENLGIGPLLQRRCRVILAFDAGADESFQFMDLANLVRWAELEEGVTLAPLDQELIQKLIPNKPLDHTAPSASGTAQKGDNARVAERHWIAARINYPGGKSGLLVYLKAGLTGDEPFDVLRFARTHDQFPHDTTVDQCYDSDQFAAYVQLGNHIANELSDVLKGQASPELNDHLWSELGTPVEQDLFRRS